jgi:hypothetical protein
MNEPWEETATGEREDVAPEVTLDLVASSDLTPRHS